MSLFWATSEYAEQWYEAESEEGALTQVLEQYPDSTTFWLGEGEPVDIASYVEDPDSMFERMGEQCEELSCLDDNFDKQWSVTDRQKTELHVAMQSVFMAWIEHHGFKIPCVVNAIREVKIAQPRSEVSPPLTHDDLNLV